MSNVISDYTPKQLSRCHFSNELDQLLALYKEFKMEYDDIADKMMESSETHDCFFNWLGFKGKEEEQLLVEYLQRKSIQVELPVEPVFTKFREEN